MSALVPVLTSAGLAAVANAQGTGLQAEIARISVGRGFNVGGVWKGYVPLRGHTALASEMARLPILSGARRSNGFTVLALLPASSPGAYPINEVGFHLSDGTLFALWSDPDAPLSYKTEQADVELGFDLSLEAIPASALTITVVNPAVPDTAGVLAELVRGLALTTLANINTAERIALRGL